MPFDVLPLRDTIRAAGVLSDALLVRKEISAHEYVLATSNQSDPLVCHLVAVVLHLRDADDSSSSLGHRDRRPRTGLGRGCLPLARPEPRAVAGSPRVGRSSCCQRAHDERRDHRLAALREHSGILTGAYGPDYLHHLREEWPT